MPKRQNHAAIVLTRTAGLLGLAFLILFNPPVSIAQTTVPDMETLGRYHFEYGTTQGWFAQPDDSKPGTTVTVEATPIAALTGNYGLHIGVSSDNVTDNWWMAAASVDNPASRMTPSGTLTAHLHVPATSTITWAKLYIIDKDMHWFEKTVPIQSGQWVAVTWNLTDATLERPIFRFGVQFGGGGTGLLNDALYLDAINWTQPTYYQPIYTGAYLSGTGTADFANDLVCFDQTGGKHAELINLFADWQTPFPTSTINIILDHQSTPMITWEPKVNSTNILADIVNGSYDSYIDAWAQAILQTQATVFLRLGHEMNGCVAGKDPPCWYPWGGNPELYKAAWQYVHDRMMITDHVGKVVWVWTPRASSGTTFADYPDYYPGDNYVDWVGVSEYNAAQKATWNPKPSCRSFDDIFGPTLDDMAARYAKPQMVAEFASACDNGCNKAVWVTEAYDQALFYPRLQALVWFNVAKWEVGDDSQWVDWSIGCGTCGAFGCPDCVAAYARALTNLRYSDCSISELPSAESCTHVVVSIAASNPDVNMAWIPSEATCEVRSSCTAPYFSSWQGTIIGTGTGGFTHFDALAAPSQYFYLMTCGKSGTSGRTGAVTFGLKPGQ
jgi:hypothetical protein